jgi:hypothetical protein
MTGAQAISRICPHCGYPTGDRNLCTECGRAEDYEQAYRLRREGRSRVALALYGDVIAAPIAVVGALMFMQTPVIGVPLGILALWAVAGALYIRRERLSLTFTRSRRMLLLAAIPAILLAIGFAVAIGAAVLSAPDSMHTR